MRWWFVYVISNANRTLYVGMTNQLLERSEQHKKGTYPNAFTKRCNFDRLVYFETFPDERAAAKREKQIKGWKRDRKLALIFAGNPEFSDLQLTYEGLLRLQ